MNPLFDAILFEDSIEDIIFDDAEEAMLILDMYDFEQLFVLWSTMGEGKAIMWPYFKRRIREFSESFFNTG